MRPLHRFSLYGFLKNQQYYDPFIVLAFLQMGLNYTLIGVLIAFREVMINVMEIPSGALADLYGRRKCMIVSFGGYIVSFLVFGSVGIWAQRGPPDPGLLLSILFAAMFFFAVGESFRTGTHKAMIFAWLAEQKRADEKTKIYGYTRSWSKIGSAVSVLLAGIFVILTNNFAYIFFFSAIPCVLNIINLLGYPTEVDGVIRKSAGLGELTAHLQDTLRESMRNRHLRRLIAESMGFEGFFKSTKDYLQPILMAAAIPMAATWFASARLTEVQSSVILIVPVYFVLFLLSAVASRKAHMLVALHGKEDKAARTLWCIMGLISLTMLPAMYFGYRWVMISGFVAMYVAQNLWRPLLVSRFDSRSQPSKAATILSIENQAKSLATMVMAPSLGTAIDLCSRSHTGATPFWPIAALGILVTAAFLATGPRNRTTTSR